MVFYLSLSTWGPWSTSPKGPPTRLKQQQQQYITLNWNQNTATYLGVLVYVADTRAVHMKQHSRERALRTGLVEQHDMQQFWLYWSLSTWGPWSMSGSGCACWRWLPPAASPPHCNQLTRQPACRRRLPAAILVQHHSSVHCRLPTLSLQP
jgi:hypothetical protein